MLKLVAIPTGQAQQPSFKVNNCGTGKGTLFFLTLEAEDGNFEAV
jgi:hypothetical protein